MFRVRFPITLAASSPCHRLGEPAAGLAKCALNSGRSLQPVGADEPEVRMVVDATARTIAIKVELRANGEA